MGGVPGHRKFALFLAAPLAIIACEGAAARLPALVDPAAPPALFVTHNQVGPDRAITASAKFAALPRPKKPEPATETSTPRPDKRSSSSLAFGR